MDSSTTDVCEWCKRPFLPPGARVTGQKAAKGGKTVELGAEVPADTADTAPPAPEPASAGPVLAGAAPLAAEEPPAPASAPAAEDILRPLGAGAPRSSADSQPFPGTGQAASDGSVDLSQYVSSGQSIFRPLERPHAPGIQASPQDRLAAAKRAAKERAPEVPETKRLMRATMAGAVVAIVVTLVEFAVTKQVPLTLLVIKVNSNEALGGALLTAGLRAVLLGFMLSAMLVRFKLGGFAGLLTGLALGWLALADVPWGLVTGGLAGLLVGIFGSKGVRRVLNV